MESKKTIFTTETVFPVLVAALSLLNLVSHLANLFSLTNLLSVVGIAGAVLYFLKNELFKKVIYIWILAQLVVVDRESLDQLTGAWLDKPFLDLTQVLNFKLGFSFMTDINKYSININLFAIFFFGLLRILRVSSLVGEQLTFNRFSQDSRLGDVFPLTGKAVERVTLLKEKDWLLIELSSAFDFKGEVINYILVKRKDGEPIRRKIKNQLVYLKVVNDVRKIAEGDNNFPFIEWVLCE